VQQGEHHSCGSGEKSKGLPEIVIGVDETPKEQHAPTVANSGVCVCVEEGGVYICSVIHAVLLPVLQNNVLEDEDKSSRCWNLTMVYKFASDFFCFCFCLAFLFAVKLSGVRFAIFTYITPRSVYMCEYVLMWV